MRAPLLALIAITASCTHHQQLPPGQTLVGPRVRLNHPRGAVEGATLGVLIGGMSGLLAGWAFHNRGCDRECLNLSNGELVVVGGAVFGGLGGLVGAVIGGVRGSRTVYEVGGPIRF